jgi:hypothetical protein
MHRGSCLCAELLVGMFAMSVMRFCAVRIFAMVLLAGCVFGQASTSTPTATQATPVSRPIEVKAIGVKAIEAKAIDLKPDATGVVPPEQIRDLLRRAEEKDLENEKRLRDYTYIEREELHKLDGHGGKPAKVKKIESRTWEILEIYGEPVARVTAKDDKTLSADEAKKEDDKIQKIIDKRQNESEDDRRKRLEKEEKGREEDRKFVREIADAFNFRLLGSEALDGRDAWVLEGEPRPGYQPKSRDARMLSKFKGRIWIDKAEAQWVKLDITAIDTISIGFVLARIHKGTHILFEQTRVNDEVWLPKQVEIHLNARVALLKAYDEDIELTFHDYRKFRTDTKMTVVGEENRE